MLVAFGLPSAFSGLSSALSAGCVTWAPGRESIATMDQPRNIQPSLIHLPDSSPSKTPGRPIRSMGIPSSASASMLSGCSRARREA